MRNKRYKNGIVFDGDHDRKKKRKSGECYLSEMCAKYLREREFKMAVEKTEVLIQLNKHNAGGRQLRSIRTYVAGLILVSRFQHL